MKRAIILFGASLALAALGGCAQFQKSAVQTRDFLSDPKTQQAAQVIVQTAKAGATLISCAVGAGSEIALAVEKAGKTAGQSTTGIVYTASSLICAKLQGQATGSIKANGGEPVVMAAPVAPAQ